MVVPHLLYAVWDDAEIRFNEQQGEHSAAAKAALYVQRETSALTRLKLMRYSGSYLHLTFMNQSITNLYIFDYGLRR